MKFRCRSGVNRRSQPCGKAYKTIFIIIQERKRERERERERERARAKIDR